MNFEQKGKMFEFIYLSQSFDSCPQFVKLEVCVGGDRFERHGHSFIKGYVGIENTFISEPPVIGTLTGMN